jgi:hypothetical protein
MQFLKIYKNQCINDFSGIYLHAIYWWQVSMFFSAIPTLALVQSTCENMRCEIAKHLIKNQLTILKKELMLSQTWFFTIFFSVVNLPYEEEGDPWWRSLRKLAAHEQELSESW